MSSLQESAEVRPEEHVSIESDDADCSGTVAVAEPDAVPSDHSDVVGSDAAAQASEPDGPIDPTGTNLVDALANLTSEVAKFHDRAAAQEALIAKMHARIEVLQSGETKKLLKPVSNQLIALYSDLEDTAASLCPDTSVEQFGGLLTNFLLMVEQILDNLGLTTLGTAAGDDFEPRMHHAIKKVGTGDPTSDRKIVEVLRQGFIEPGEAKPLAPSRVSVFRYEGSRAEFTSTADTGEQ